MANLLSTNVNGSLLIGPSGASTSYSAAATDKLYFGSTGSDSSTYYHIGTYMENVGGNYSKLDIRWYTGQRFYAHQGYGGFRFKEITTGNDLFSIGYTDGHVRVENNLYVGNTIYNNGNAVIHTGNIGSQSVSYASSAGNANTLDSLDSSDFARGRAAYQVMSLDDIKQPGLYQYDGGIGGTQPEGTDQANLRTIEIGSGGRYTQMAFDWASEQAWFRRQTGSTWSTWREFIHSGNIASQSVSYADESGYSASSGSVEWGNVNSRPTALSQFTNDLGNYGGWITGYTETDTLASVTGRGATTAGNITVNGTLSTGNTIMLGFNVNGSIATTEFRGINFHTTDDLNYYIGKPAGAWTQPLDIHFYTGIHLKSHGGYGGTRFTNLDSGNTILTVGGGNDFVKVLDRLQVSSTMNLNYDQLWTSSGNLHLQYSGSGNIDMNYGGGYTFSHTSFRAPIFYDSNDTYYYVDPNSTSRLVSTRILGEIRFQNGSYYNNLEYWGARMYSQDDGGGVPLYVQVQWAAGWRQALKIASGMDDNNPSLRTYYTTQLATDAGNVSIGGTASSHKLHVYGTGYATSDFRAPIFYDSDDTTYFLDPNSASRINRLNISDGQVMATNNPGGRLRISSYTNGESVINGNTHNITLGPYSTRTGAGLYYAGIAINGLMNYNGGTSYDVAPHIWLGGYYRDTPGSERSDFVVAIKSGTGTSGAGSDLPQPRFRVDYEGIASATGSFRAPIFYDSQNTTYYCDPNDYSSFWGLAIRGDQNSTYGGNQIFFYGGGNTTTSAIGFKSVAGVWAEHGATSAAYNTYFTMDTANRGWIFRRATVGGSDWTGVNVASISNTGHAQFDGSVRSPIFYDSNDTTYYLDPSSTGSSLVVAGYTKSKFTYRNNSAAGLPGQDNPVKTATGVLATLSGNGGGYEYIIIKTRVPQDSYQMGGFTIDLFANYYSTNAKTTISLGGYWNAESNGGFQGWEYNTTNPNVRPSIQVMRDATDGSTCFAIQISKSYPIVVARDLYLGYTSSDIEGWLDWSIFGADDLGNYTNNDTVACRHAMPVDNWYGNTYIANDGRFYGTIFYDSNDSSYYCDPSGTSRLNVVNDNGGNTYGAKYFYSNKGSTATLGTSSSPALQAYSDDNGPAFMSFHRSPQYAVNFGLDNDNVLRVGGWSASANRMQLDMSGNVTFAGDVTAYSDARVKENVHTIENALDKTLQLRGVTYNRTDSEDKSTKVGVIAQEVLEVVPEVVNQDASGMYNVSYGNLTAVLIEAIKEQQKQIDELKEIINGLTK